MITAVIVIAAFVFLTGLVFFLKAEADFRRSPSVRSSYIGSSGAVILMSVGMVIAVLALVVEAFQ